MNESYEAGQPYQPTLWDGLWRYPWTVAVFVALFVGLGLLYYAISPASYETTSGLVIDDPRGPRQFEVTELAQPSTQDSERYLADQVEIMRSTVAADVAGELTEGRLSPEQILENREIIGDAASNLIQIVFRARDPETAKLGADALANSYMELHRRQIQQTADVARQELDKLLAATDADIEDISRRIDEQIAQNPELAELNTQFQGALTQLNGLRAERNAAPLGSVTRTQLNDQIGELLTDFQAWEVVLGTEPRNALLQALLEEQDALIAERASLAARRNAISVDAELAAGGVALFSPAPVPVQPAGPDLPTTILIAAALGLVFAGVVSYRLALRHRVLADPASPEAVLRAPLLAEIPRFGDERIKGDLPVWTHPSSKAADAFRLASTALDVRSTATDSKTVLVVAARLGTGTSAIVANTGLSVAAGGVHVLAIDGDLAEQRLSALLGAEDRAGLTDLARGAPPERALHGIRVAEGGVLDILSRGHEPVESANFLRSPEVEILFERMRERFDLVLIDSPPLLESASASTLARYADAAVVVVEHESNAEEVEDVARRLGVIGTPVIGYMYTYHDRRHARPTPHKAKKGERPVPVAEEQLNRESGLVTRLNTLEAPRR